MIKAKKSIRDMSPYINGHHNQKIIENHKKILKLDSNESTIGPSPKVMGSVMQFLQEGPLNWYPDVEASTLSQRIAQYTHMPKKCILTFNGSDHALETIARTFLSAGDQVIYFQPTYDHFRVYAESCDATMIPVAENQNTDFIQNLEPAMNDAIKMVYLVNPNNPTGHCHTLEEIEVAVARYPHVVFVVDEAYFEFCDMTVSPLILHHANLIVTRSFSKAFGLAGFRCGYLLATSSLCQQISKIRVGKNINAVAQVAASAALVDIDYMRRYVHDVNMAKKWLGQKFEELGLPFKLTPANFILVRVHRPQQVISFLEQHNIHARDRSNMPQLEGTIRVTIGDQLSMKRFWKIFKTIPSAALFDEAVALENTLQTKLS